MSAPPTQCLEDEEVVAFVERRLPEARQLLVLQHVDGCDDCRRLLSSMARLSTPEETPRVHDGQDATFLSTPRPEGEPVPEPPGLLQRGQSIDRYVVLGAVGSGGMGVVYAAYDPELDRKVALKLLRTDLAQPGEEPIHRARLLREAQTMARVAHPNVVTVHDAGTWREQVFVAMEFVEGMTLKRWLRETPRGWREVLEVYTQAGRGLAAAHAAGLVHRDFKPDNVLIGPGARVRVTDFGLARGATDGEAARPVPVMTTPEAMSPTTPGDGQRLSDRTLTRTGHLLGTPAYMAPERHLGKPAGPAADQFGFCVALWEALHGARPFDGPTLDGVVSAMLAGRLTDPPPGVPPARVPGWLRRVVLRGLAADPNARHPSMDALLDALAARPRSLRRTALVATAVLSVGAVAFFAGRPGQAALCHGAEQRLEGIWDAGRKAALRERFVGADANGFTADAWARTEQVVDGYARAWAAMRTEACEATRVRGDQSDEVLSLRMLCLDRRRAELEALTALFDQAGGGTPVAREATVKNAVASARALAPLDLCADVAALRAVVPPPDPATRERVDALRGELAAVKALLDTGQYATGLERGRAVVASARAVHYPPSLAEALFLLGALEEKMGDYPASEKALLEAASAAAEGKLDRVTAQAWVALVNVVGSRQGRFEAGRQWQQPAEAAIARLGGSAELTAMLESHLGYLAWAQGKYDEAAERDRRTLALREALLGPKHLDVAATLNNLGICSWSQGKYDDAIGYYRRALALREELLGPKHPEVAGTLSNIGVALWNQGKHAEAIGYYRRALALREEVLGKDHLDVAASLTNLGVALCRQSLYAECAESHRRALAILERTLGPEHRDVALSLNNLGTVLNDLGDPVAAEAIHRRALAIREKTLGPEHPQVAASLERLGYDLAAQKRTEEALAALQRASAIDLKALGKEHPYHADTLKALARVLLQAARPQEALAASEEALAILEKKSGAESNDTWSSLRLIGLSQLALGAPAKAVPPLERALAKREKTLGDPSDVGEVRFALARALWGAGGDKARALALATQARHDYLSAAPSLRAELPAVEGWLAKRGGGPPAISAAPRP